MAPLLPGLSADRVQVQRTVQAAAEHGARFLGSNLLHVGPELRGYFLDFVGSEYPDLLEGYRRLYGDKYAPKRYRDRVDERVREVREAAGVPGRVHRQAPTQPAPDRQLALPLR